MPKLERTTFTLTQQQIEWIDEQSKKTGLLKAEIMRRAVDQYAEQEEAKEERQFFTPEQRREIKEIARAKGVSELSVIRRAIDRELNRFFRRY
ncbi:MAG: ribbon-helix-helix protein, CopG family [Candidatus Poribacteria bacterium]|nr:ribbon-helix-helix protein, CopG family [Candidatus Poribacteria bacterium]